MYFANTHQHYLSEVRLFQGSLLELSLEIGLELVLVIGL
jgi:hypothetical protein